MSRSGWLTLQDELDRSLSGQAVETLDDAVIRARVIEGHIRDSQHSVMVGEYSLHGHGDNILLAVAHFNLLPRVDHWFWLRATGSPTLETHSVVDHRVVRVHEWEAAADFRLVHTRTCNTTTVNY